MKCPVLNHQAAITFLIGTRSSFLFLPRVDTLVLVPSSLEEAPMRRQDRLCQLPTIISFENLSKAISWYLEFFRRALNALRRRRADKWVFAYFWCIALKVHFLRSLTALQIRYFWGIWVLSKRVFSGGLLPALFWLPSSSSASGWQPSLLRWRSA